MSRLLFATLLLTALLAGCGAAVSTPTVARTATASPNGTTVPAVTRFASAAATSTATAAPSRTTTATPAPSPSPVPTALPTAAPSATATAKPSPLPTPGDVPTATARPEPTAVAPGAASPLVAVDPGHGGGEIGAARLSAGGQALREKDVNLAIARRLKVLLEAGGYRVLLTRDADTGANVPAVDRNGDGLLDTQDDLQARIDKANAAGAQLLLSLHNNGSPSAEESGSEVYYCQHREYGERSLALAEGLQRAFVRRLAEVGYAPRDRGVKGDTNFRVLDGVPQHASLLGPPQPPRIPRASQMPAALGESLFLSHPEGDLLARADVQQAIAQAYFDAVAAYFALYPAR